MEVNHEPGAGDFFDLPKDAENIVDSGAEEGAGESEIFGMVFSGDDRGFAGGEGCEVKVVQVEVGDRSKDSLEEEDNDLH